MVRNKQKYQEAVALRKRGFTLEEIAKVCDVSKSTVSKWLKNNAFSAQVTKQNQRRARRENGKRLKLVQKARNLERTKRYQEAERSATTEYKHYAQSPLFTAGLMLYASHGDKNNNGSIRFTTTEQVSHQIFIKFLQEFLGVQVVQLRIQLTLHKKHSEEACMRSWRRFTGLPYAQFHKTQYLRHTSPAKPLHSGVGSTIICSTVLKRKLLRWVQLAQKDLIQ